MFLQRQHCEICGAKRDFRFHDGFLYLGPARVECPACWAPISTGRREWRDMRREERTTFLLQPLAMAFPVVVFAIVTLIVSVFFTDDLFLLIEYCAVSGVVAFFAVALLLELRAFLQIRASLSRTRARAVASTSL